ncbi:MAG TPA: hypothetical protein DDY78_10620 [Planctomycetales bacterium]|nr:hypothetical protein [Planctomycetales bacterium]
MPQDSRQSLGCAGVVSTFAIVAGVAFAAGASACFAVAGEGTAAFQVVVAVQKLEPAGLACARDDGGSAGAAGFSSGILAVQDNGLGSCALTTGALANGIGRRRGGSTFFTTGGATGVRRFSAGA